MLGEVEASFRGVFDPTIFVSLAFLFGIAAQFSAADGFALLRRVLSSLEGRLGLMYSVVLVTAVVSPFILNDVLILILTPVLVAHCKESGAEVAPLLVAEVTFTNLSSALTPLGNPQNILLWQATGVSFASFVEATWLPLLASGAIASLALLGLRDRRRAATPPAGRANLAPAAYLVGVVAIVFVLNLLRVSGVVSLGLAFAFGFAFTYADPKRVVEEYEARSLLILCALVGVIALVAGLFQGAIAPYLRPVASASQPEAAAFFALVSAVISNVPATQLVLSTASVSPHVAPILAVDAGLAGNIDPVSSFANLLALVMVSRSGLPLRRTVVLQLVIGGAAFIPALLW